MLSAVFESDLDGMLAAPRRLPSVGGRGAGGVNAATAASSGGRTDPVRHPEVRQWCVMAHDDQGTVNVNCY